MVHDIKCALGAFMNSLGVRGRTKSCEAHKCDQYCGGNESTHNGKSQRFRKEGNARINKEAAMRPGLAKIIEKACISSYFDTPQTAYDIAANACCIEYTGSWPSKLVD